MLNRWCVLIAGVVVESGLTYKEAQKVAAKWSRKYPAKGTVKIWG